MHGGGTGEIMEAEFRKPAAAPDPMTGNGIDQRAQYGAEDQIGGKFRPFRHGAGDDRRRGGAEDGLENQKSKGGIRSGVIPSHQKVRCADEAEVGSAEHQTKAEHPKDHGAHAEIHHIFHYDVPGVFTLCQTGFHHAKAGLHKKDQSRTEEYPQGIN